eukprot:2844224-Prymnesium_polylepis.1
MSATGSDADGGMSACNDDLARPARQQRLDAFVKRTAHKKRAREECGGRPTVVELFSGAGGMALGLGLEQAGFRHVALIERNAECVNTLRANGFRRVMC